MTWPSKAVLIVAYVGAGAFYAAADIPSETRSKQAFVGLSGALAAATLACMWAPASVANLARIGLALGWRNALAYLGSIVVPSLAIFLGAVLFAASLV